MIWRDTELSQIARLRIASHALEIEDAGTRGSQLRKQIDASAWMSWIVADEGEFNLSLVDCLHRCVAVVKACSNGSRTQCAVLNVLPIDLLPLREFSPISAADCDYVNAFQSGHSLKKVDERVICEFALCDIRSGGDHDLIAYSSSASQKINDSATRTFVNWPMHVGCEKEEIDTSIERCQNGPGIWYCAKADRAHFDPGSGNGHSILHLRKGNAARGSLVIGGHRAHVSPSWNASHG